MDITCLPVGSLQTNCYLATDPKTHKTIIIDPGDEADFITSVIIEKKLVPQAIALTHGHYDHCLGALELKLNFNLPIYLNQDDLFLYQNSHKSAKFFSNITIPHLPKPDKFLNNEDIITFGASKLQIIHTPGHTPGSVCFYSDSIFFTGDTLFASGSGSTEHKYSSKSKLQESLKKIKNISETTLATINIYPGHEEYDIPLNL